MVRTTPCYRDQHDLCKIGLRGVVKILKAVIHDEVVGLNVAKPDVVFARSLLGKSQRHPNF